MKKIATLAALAWIASSPAMLGAGEAENEAARAIEKLGAKIKRDEIAPGKPVVAVHFELHIVLGSGFGPPHPDMNNAAP